MMPKQYRSTAKSKRKAPAAGPIAGGDPPAPSKSRRLTNNSLEAASYPLVDKENEVLARTKAAAGTKEGEVHAPITESIDPDVVEEGRSASISGTARGFPGRDGHEGGDSAVDANAAPRIDPGNIDAGHEPRHVLSPVDVNVDEHHGSSSTAAESNGPGMRSSPDVFALLQQSVPALADISVEDLKRSMLGPLQQQALAKSSRNGSPRRSQATLIPNEDALSIRGAVRYALREQMHVRGHGPLPPYPIATRHRPGESAEWQDIVATSRAGQGEDGPTKPLRIDWLAIDKSSATTALLLDSLVRQIDENRSDYTVGRHIARSAIRDQAWIVLRDYRAQFRRQEERPDAIRQRRELERDRSRRAERRREKSIKRLRALAGLADYEGPNDQRNKALYEDAMSEVETDTEETAKRSANGEPGKAGRRWIPAWRSQEMQDLLNRLDAHRDLTRSTIISLPGPTLRFTCLPRSSHRVEKWMVSQLYRDVYTNEVKAVADNSGTHHDLAATAWGSSLPFDMPRPSNPHP